jgi:Asp-tRNA(Asn)/Glu-tRNA(Gln) amidotransferase C subunit
VSSGGPKQRESLRKLEEENNLLRTKFDLLMDMVSVLLKLDAKRVQILYRCAKISFGILRNSDESIYCNLVAVD